MVAAVGAVLAEQDTADWLKRLVPAGIVVAGVDSLEAALANEQTAARSMVVTISTPDGPMRLVGNPIKIAGQAGSFAQPPLLGSGA